VAPSPGHQAHSLARRPLETVTSRGPGAHLKGFVPRASPSRRIRAPAREIEDLSQDLALA